MPTDEEISRWPNILTPVEVLAIIHRVIWSDLDYKTIGDEFGVTGSAIGLITNRKRWPNIWLDLETENRLYVAASKRARMRGEDHPLARLTNDDVRKLRSFAADGLTTKELAVRFGIRESTVREIVAGRSRRYG